MLPFILPLLLVTIACSASVLRRGNISKIPHSAWDELNTQVHGRLHAEYPAGASCYLRYKGALNKHADINQCNELLESQNNASFMASYAQGYAYSTWPICIADGEQCNTRSRWPPSLVKPVVGNCQQGSVPDWYIDAHTDEDIRAGLAFAKKYDIPLVIKASGHDYKGRSAGKHTLLIWVYNYQSDLKFEEDFVPVGASEPVGDVITFGAGRDFQAVASLADQHGGAVITGTSPSVHPAGGYLQGGGHSPLSVIHGLAVDNAYQIEGILVNGTSFKASRQQNADLFFALRGGGGGTFAVVTKVSTLFHPNPSHGYQVALVVLKGVTREVSSQLLKVFIANAEQWTKDGWGGYVLPSFHPNDNSCLVGLINGNLSLEEATASLAPLADLLSTIPKRSIPTNVFSTVDSYFTIFEIFSNMSGTAGSGITESSRLVPVENFRGQQNQEALFNALYSIGSAGDVGTQPLFISLTTPYSYEAGADASTSSVTPAWRRSLWHVIAVNEWDANQSTKGIVNEFRKSHDAIQALVELTPGSGAYQNEADTYETDPKGSFWGQENYDKLLAIKKEYDPGNVFAVWQGVGWDREDPRWGCYPKS